MTAYDRRISAELVHSVYRQGFRDGVLVAGALAGTVVAALVGLVWWRLS